MNIPRYIVLDDAPNDSTLGWTADQFADALRSPLAAIGVRVVRQHGVASGRRPGGFQARGCSRNLYVAKLNKVGHVVDGVLTRSAATGLAAAMPRAGAAHSHETATAV
jgi:hypothetical protein